MSIVSRVSASWILPPLLLLGLPAVVQAQFNYTTTNGTITITGYYGPGGELSIPSTIIGLPVITIGESAFSNFASLTNVSIPNTVTSIGGWAFAFCTSLTSVIIPNSVTNIGDRAFYGCGNLTSIAIPNSVTNIGDWEFQDCWSLTSVTIPNGVTSIGDGAFYACSGLTNVTIPDSVVSIGDYAFQACNSLTSVTIPNIPSIGEETFSGCARLSTVIIPKSVTRIGMSAFYACTSLTSVYFQGSAPSADSSVFGGDPATIYYLPGTTGWGLTFGGCPATLWEIVPVITLQPQSQTANPGEIVTFAVAANGTVATNATAPLSYQWLFNGGAIGGATTNTYIINNVQPPDAGNYSVVVSNLAGSVTSAVAVLTVLFPHAASATATVVNGFLVEASITDQGWGYTNTPGVRIIGGGGSGAEAVAVVSNEVVTAVSIVDPGSGFTNTPVIVIAPPFIPQPTMAIEAMSLLSFTNLAVGTNYQLQSLFEGSLTTVGPSFTANSSTFTQLVSGTAWTNSYLLTTTLASTQAQAAAQVVNGFVVGATVTSGGSGYTTNPAVTIVNDGAGSNATATATVSGGSVTNITIMDAGGGYTNGATIIIAPPPAKALWPNVTQVVELNLGSSSFVGSLSPYDNYQLGFTPVVDGAWTNLNTPFTPTSMTYTQYINVTGTAGFFRLMYVP
jgi:hypothetical protein